MKIDILCPSGSPIGLVPADIYERGVGGAELALMSLARQFAKNGHNVSIYNNPNAPGVYEGVGYKKIDEWNHADERDVAILFRCPHHTFSAAKGKRIFWSTDQYTVGNYSVEIFPHAHKIVTISDFHANYFEKTYSLSRERMEVIGLGVRVDEYQIPIEKIKNQMIFCSVPGRGLDILAHMWPRIRREIPDATLVITSDYRLWGNPSPENHEYRLLFAGQPGVTFYGKVPRVDLVRLQLQSDVMVHPCTYDELFCISAAEAHVAGAVPVTSGIGALATTNKFGIQVDGNPRTPEWQERFVRTLKMVLVDRRDMLEQLRAMCIGTAEIDFDWGVIALQWEGMIDGIK